MLNGGSELLADVVVDVFAAVGGERLRAIHELVPLLFCESVLQVVFSNSVFDKPEDETGIEIVACSHRADCL